MSSTAMSIIHDLCSCWPSICHSSHTNTNLYRNIDHFTLNTAVPAIDGSKIPKNITKVVLVSIEWFSGQPHSEKNPILSADLHQTARMGKAVPSLVWGTGPAVTGRGTQNVEGWPVVSSAGTCLRNKWTEWGTSRRRARPMRKEVDELGPALVNTAFCGLA